MKNVRRPERGNLIAEPTRTLLLGTSNGTFGNYHRRETVIFESVEFRIGGGASELFRR